MDLNTELSNAIDDFVSNVSLLAQKLAVDSIKEALGMAAMNIAGPSATRSSSPFHDGRSRRSSDELTSLAEAFHAFVSKHPGLRIEQINKQLNTTTKVLARPVQKLIAEGALKTKGQRRAMVYFAIERKR